MSNDPLTPSGDAPRARRGELLTEGEPISVADIRDALVIKEGDLFLMTDPNGDLPSGADRGFGLYKGDTRYLAVYDLSFDDVRATVLLSTAELGYGSEHHLTNPPMVTLDGRSILKETIEVRRRRVIGTSLLEEIQLTNFNIFPVTIGLRFHFSADFLDIFEFRGEKRKWRGSQAIPKVQPHGVEFSYLGVDDVWRKTRLKFSPAPEEVSESGARFVISLQHLESFTISVAVILDDANESTDFPAEFERISSSYSSWMAASTQVFTSNEFFNAMVERSLRDIRMLTIEGEGGAFVAAGTPWFSSLFGRDSLITAFQMLAYNPGLARDALRVLARSQGEKFDDWRDEEPGKILHELRTGEMASLDEIPMNPYYGSIDSTPLFIMLAAKYVAWTGDMELIREIRPNIEAALRWLEDRCNADPAGYLSYSKRSSKGLINQGWKDSHDGIVNRNGSFVRPPIALAEVQGYVYAAHRGVAYLYALLGHEALAREHRRKASAFKARFNRDFWMEEQRFYALASGGDKQLAASITSNPGQCLWTGIVDGDKAPLVVERLLSNDMFSGWGIRTLSDRANRYNPLGYHLGTVWPHDNSLIGMGFKRYGFDDELGDLATAMYDACRSFDYYRLPELFSGVARTTHGPPVGYPVAARPQAWAAGTIAFFLTAILGLAPNAPKHELRLVRPKLPHWLDSVELRGLRIGDDTVDLYYEQRQGRTKVTVTSADRVKVIRTNVWPTSSFL